MVLPIGNVLLQNQTNCCQAVPQKPTGYQRLHFMGLSPFISRHSPGYQNLPYHRILPWWLKKWGIAFFWYLFIKKIERFFLPERGRMCRWNCFVFCPRRNQEFIKACTKHVHLISCQCGCNQSFTKIQWHRVGKLRQIFSLLPES